MSNTKKSNNTMEPIQEIMPEQPQRKSVKEVLAENVIMIHGLNFTMAEAEKFMPIFSKIKNDLMACVEAIEKEEQKQKQKEAKQNAEADSK